MDCSPPGSSVQGNNTGVGCHSLLQEVFPTRSNRDLPHGKQILYCLSLEGSPVYQLYFNLKKKKTKILNHSRLYFFQNLFGLLTKNQEKGQGWILWTAPRRICGAKWLLSLTIHSFPDKYRITGKNCCLLFSSVRARWQKHVSNWSQNKAGERETAGEGREEIQGTCSFDPRVQRSAEVPLLRLSWALGWEDALRIHFSFMFYIRFLCVGLTLRQALSIFCPL